MGQHFLDRLEQESLPNGVVATFNQMYATYKKSLEDDDIDPSFLEELIGRYLDVVITNINTPYTFPPYHEKKRFPFDYYQFGMDFIRPLVKMEDSTFQGSDNLNKILTYIARGDNVVLLANHQTEPDPQAINLLIERQAPQLGEEMIFVAGHRVTTDPLVVPFSLGRNLLCIFSKKYIDHPPEEKPLKVTHNQRTMKKMGELLSMGSKCIYVAPSGGRDRPNSNGTLSPSPFDPQGIEMFWFTARYAKTPTHFFPLALKTANLFPPPEKVSIELGEQRLATRTAIHGSLGDEIDMVNFPGSDSSDKKERRQKRADYIWTLVNELYSGIDDR